MLGKFRVLAEAQSMSHEYHESLFLQPVRSFYESTLNKVTGVTIFVIIFTTYFTVNLVALYRFMAPSTFRHRHRPRSFW